LRPPPKVPIQRVPDRGDSKMAVMMSLLMAVESPGIFL
jgi:hypothetical protein